jgi:hypothetical protein
MTAEPTSQQSQQSNIVGRLLRTKKAFTLNDRPRNLISVSLLTELQTVTKGSAVLVLQYCDMGGYAHIRVLTAAGEVGWIPAYAEDYCVAI